MEGIAQIDRGLTLAVNALNSPVSDSIWMFFSDREVWIPLYVIVAVMLYVRLGWKKATLAVIGLVLTIVACDQTANLLKFSVARLRPCHDGWMLERGLRALEDPGGLYGFFSAHAANAFGFAVCSIISFGCGRTTGRAHSIYGWCIIAWAVLLSLSRVFVGKHFLGDIIVGTAVGILFGLLFGSLVRAICKCTGSDRL